MKAPTIMECTLRDGSYALDFQFTENDTEKIGRALDQVGFEYIEVGHGIGLGASESTDNVAAAADLEYMQAAQRAISKNKWGMFCIPGIATLDHVRMAADQGMDFIRIGTNVTEIDRSEEFIGLARDRGMEVFANFMKSYALSPEDFAKLARRSVTFGANLVYLVDSAGGMLPNKVREYLQATKSEIPGISLGFHGHNNLGLAVANCMVCAEENVTLIDSSLQGFGRSAGNASTEQLLCVLLKAGYHLRIDPILAMNVGESMIRPMIIQRGISSLDTTAGWALFHSSYMPTILHVAKKCRVDPRRLILELCAHDKINAPLELLTKLAKDLTSRGKHQAISTSWGTYPGEEQ